MCVVGGCLCCCALCPGAIYSLLPPALTGQELFTALEAGRVDGALSAVVYLEAPPPPSFAHELYLYQCYALNRLDKRRHYPYNPQDKVSAR